MFRHTGYRPLTQLRGEMDRLLGDLFHAVGPIGAPVANSPALNVWEQADMIFAEAEVPGLAIENLEISVQGTELSLKGKYEGPHPAEGTYHRRERASGEFARTVRLPVEVDADQVQARLQDGVLLVTLPKAAAARPRRIKVNVGG